MMLFAVFFAMGALIACGSSTGTSTTDDDDDGSRAAVEESDENLIAHYKFDEGSGSTISDSSGNSYDGTLVDGSWVTGLSGQAIYFDGSDDGIAIPNEDDPPPSAISDLATGSVSLWFKYEGDVGDTGLILPIFYIGPARGEVTVNGLIIEIGHQGIWNDNTELFYTVTTDDIRPISCFDSGENLTADQWYHFVVVVTDSGNTGYLNGVEITDRDYNFGDSSSSYFLSAPEIGMLSIGYGRFAVDGEFHSFHGTIDDVRIYSDALTAAEITALYEAFSE